MQYCAIESYTYDEKGQCDIEGCRTIENKKNQVRKKEKCNMVQLTVSHQSKNGITDQK